MLFGLAAADCVLLLLIAYCILAGAADWALPLIPTFSALFLVLVATLARFAERRRVSWWLVCGAALSGPAGAAAALRLGRRLPHRP